VVEPAILKAVQGVEQRHVEEANHLSDGIDGEEANNHSLEDHRNTDHSDIHQEERNVHIHALEISIVVLFV